MKLFLAFFAGILAVSALPTDIGREVDLGIEPDFGIETDYGLETDIGSEGVILDPLANFTDARTPAGQYGFAAMNGGTNGGNGGATWTVWDGWALRDAVRGNDRRVVNVRGRIDLTPLFTASPGVRFDVGSFTTVNGGDSNAMIFGGGLNIRNVQQVIIQNIKIHNALSYAPGERPNGNGGIISMVPGAWSTIDNIGIENSAQVWINHCEFADDPWNSANTPDNQRRHDGLIDITRGANFISISNSIFRNHNLVSLVGNDDNNGAQDRGRLKTTWYFNWFQGVTQRNPRVRFGEVHVLNNLYTDIRSYGIGVGVAASIYAERNCFINSRRAWGWASGVPNPMGHLLNFNNILVNSGFDAGITGGSVNWRPDQYYRYNPIAAANVEAHVRRFAGTR